MPEPERERPEKRRTARFREISFDRRGEFVARGLPARYFFPHRIFYLPKCGPDALKLGRRMCGETRLNGYWELLLHAHPSLLDRFHQELFLDDDVIWHRQQYGTPGHVAFATLVVKDGNLYGLNYVSDLVQRISRRRDDKTRIENVFKGWHYLLLNGIMNFAVEHRLARIYSPTAALIRTQTDPERTVQMELFERVYDRAVNQQWSVTREGNWWVIDVSSNRDRLVMPVTAEKALSEQKTICISHDIERGFGHLGIDAERARLAERIAPGALSDTLEREQAAGLKTTYNVLGRFFDEVRSEIERGGHCLAFHSYNHRLRKWWPVTKHVYRVRRLLASLTGGDIQENHEDQLYSCRVVDRRVRGFRPPQSYQSAEWSDYNLLFRSFDWYATSARALGTGRPSLQNGLVKIPIHFDEFPLYKAGASFAEWERRALRTIEHSDFVVFGLHDCYADLWLSHYPEFLRRIADLGTFKTLDQVADDTILAHAA